MQSTFNAVFESRIVLRENVNRWIDRLVYIWMELAVGWWFNGWTVVGLAVELLGRN